MHIGPLSAGMAAFAVRWMQKFLHALLTSGEN